MNIPRSVIVVRFVAAAVMLALLALFHFVLRPAPDREESLRRASRGMIIRAPDTDGTLIVHPLDGACPKGFRLVEKVFLRDGKFHPAWVRPGQGPVEIDYLLPGEAVALPVPVPLILVPEAKSHA